MWKQGSPLPTAAAVQSRRSLQRATESNDLCRAGKSCRWAERHVPPASHPHAFPPRVHNKQPLFVGVPLERNVGLEPQLVQL